MQFNTIKRPIAAGVAAIFLLSACATNPDGSYKMDEKATGALIGAAAGCAIGAAAKGAQGCVVGAAVGAAQDAQERPPFIATGARPKVAILREQGVNSQIETAVAFDRSGFDAFDVHMSDLVAGRFDLAGFDVLLTLRRRGKGLALSPSELAQDMMISTSAMTTRRLTWSEPEMVMVLTTLSGVPMNLPAMSAECR